MEREDLKEFLNSFTPQLRNYLLEGFRYADINDNNIVSILENDEDYDERSFPTRDYKNENNEYDSLTRYCAAQSEKLQDYVDLFDDDEYTRLEELDENINEVFFQGEYANFTFNYAKENDKDIFERIRKKGIEKTQDYYDSWLRLITDYHDDSKSESLILLFKTPKDKLSRDFCDAVEIILGLYPDIHFLPLAISTLKEKYDSKKEFLDQMEYCQNYPSSLTDKDNIFGICCQLCEDTGLTSEELFDFLFGDCSFPFSSKFNDTDLDTTLLRKNILNKYAYKSRVSALDLVLGRQKSARN